MKNRTNFEKAILWIRMHCVWRLDYFISFWALIPLLDHGLMWHRKRRWTSVDAASKISRIALMTMHDIR
jgi:hypothetical protein